PPALLRRKNCPGWVPRDAFGKLGRSCMEKRDRGARECIRRANALPNKARRGSAMIAVGLAVILSATLLTSGPVLAKSGSPLNVSLYGTARHVTFDGVDAIEASSACPTGSPTCFGDGSFTYGGVGFRTPKGSGLTFADLATL